MRIVVIDNDRHLLEGIMEILEIMGCQVSGASDPDECRRLIEQHRPHLLMLDMSGVGVLHWVREQSPVPGLSVILLQESSRTPDLDIDAALAKPFDAEDMLSVVLRFADSDQATGVRRYLEMGIFPE